MLNEAEKRLQYLDSLLMALFFIYYHFTIVVAYTISSIALIWLVLPTIDQRAIAMLAIIPKTP